MFNGFQSFTSAILAKEEKDKLINALEDLKKETKVDPPLPVCNNYKI